MPTKQLPYCIYCAKQVAEYWAAHDEAITGFSSPDVCTWCRVQYGQDPMVAPPPGMAIPILGPITRYEQAHRIPGAPGFNAWW